MRLLLALSLFALTSSAAKIGTIKKHINSYACFKKVENVSKKWGMKGEWKLYIGANGDLGLKRPTRKISHWINVEKTGDLEVASLIDPIRVQQALFDPNKNCSVKFRSFKHGQYSDPSGMNDARLISTMAENRNGIILMWSPGMGHSFTAMERLKKLAKKKDLHLSFVMDPFASIDNAKKRLKEKKLEIKDILPLSSLELMQREAMMHYPAFFVYKDGQIVGNIVPGLMTEDKYKNKVEELLK